MRKMARRMMDVVKTKGGLLKKEESAMLLCRNAEHPRAQNDARDREIQKERTNRGSTVFGWEFRLIEDGSFAQVRAAERA